MVTATANPPSARRRFQYPSEFACTLFALVFTIMAVHATYVAWIRPQGEAITQLELERMKEDRTYVPKRSFFLVIKDFEQELEIMHFVWAMLIIGYKAVLVRRERKFLERELIHVPEGIKVLPEDAKDYARQLEALTDDKDRLVVRALQRTLDRFAATRSIRDSAETSKTVCDSEADRLDSSLAMIRYIAWAIPAIGFIGTVRGIGDALAQAHRAMQGDLSGVTQGLGTAFNSTLIALLLSLVLMFLLHHLQTMQERLVRDAGTGLDDRLLQNLRAA